VDPDTEIRRRRAIEQIIDDKIKRCAGTDPAGRSPGPPASEHQIAALEQHWGWPLPLPYRWVLSRHNGIPRLWFDLELLPIEAILSQGHEMRAFEATAPEYWPWIFARLTESHDALAFDPLGAAHPDELCVVHLGEAGTVKRFPSFAEGLNAVCYVPMSGPRGRGTKTVYLWTGLWPYWGGDSSPHSRAFSAGGAGVEYAGREGLHGVQWNCIDRVCLLPEAVLAEADGRFERAVRGFAREARGLAILLTERPAQPSAVEDYVYYEPFADLVVALSTAEKRASICATNTLWDRWGASFQSIMARATGLLEQDRVGDALLGAIDEAGAMFRAIRGRNESSG